MTPDQFDAAYQAFCRRRPLRAFLIHFLSGDHVSVGHPEAVRKEANLYVMRCSDGGFVVFAADSVSHVRDVPTGK
jgi:hypothetical protein